MYEAICGENCWTFDYSREGYTGFRPFSLK
jgi:hypothetical protein